MPLFRTRRVRQDRRLGPLPRLVRNTATAVGSDAFQADATQADAFQADASPSRAQVSWLSLEVPAADPALADKVPYNVDRQLVQFRGY